MKRRLIFLFVILAALILCYGMVVRFAPAPRPPKWVTASMARANEGGLMPPGAQEGPGEYDYVTVQIDIPGLSEFPAPWAERGGCPHMRISRTLGAAIGGGNGVPVFSVEPGKPAAKAGIQPGDRLGAPSDCPSSLYNSLTPRKEPRTIEWTIRRPKGEAPERPAAGPSPAPQPSDPKAGSA